jgi:hypothetical protein
VPLYRLRGPRLTEDIATISPSAAARLERCPLSVAFANDEEFEALARRGSHFAALGEICHRLWEQEGERAFDDVDDSSLGTTLNNAWASAEAAVIRRLRASLGDVEPPPPRQWPAYLTKRLGVISLIKQSVQARRSAIGNPRATGPTRRSLVEDPITTPDQRMTGRPDRVVWDHDQPHIVDLKTCAAPDVMSDQHRRQLLAYAFLFHSKHGVWPVTATIQYVGGARHSLVVHPQEADTIASDMLEALDQLNSAVDKAELDFLGRPSPEACRWCNFKAACAPFFAAVSADWELFDRHVLGVVDEVDVTAPTPWMTLGVIRGNVNVDSLTVVASSAAVLDGIEVGDQVAVTGATQTKSAATVRCDWSSVVCIWAPAD